MALLAPGSWFLALGSWLLAPGPWLLPAGSWLLAPGPWQALTRLLAAKPSPSGPTPSSEVRLGGKATSGLPAGEGEGGGCTHRRSVLRGMFLGMACSPAP